MATDEELGFPNPTDDERELLLGWLRFLRGAVLRNLDGLADEQAHWQPDGRLISLAGVVNHLTHVEWRWIDGGFGGARVSRDEAEFRPDAVTTVRSLRETYAQRAEATEAVVRALPLDTLHVDGDGRDLRWVLLHLIHETGRHCGHADATRELLDGTTGE